MKNRFIILFAITCFVIQIIFSVYYSIKIVDQNTQYNNRQDKLQISTIEQQHLEIEKAKRQSLSSLIETSTKMLFTPIKSTIDLTK